MEAAKAAGPDSGRNRCACGTESGLVANHRFLMKDSAHTSGSEPLRLLSIVIPARGEEGCIASAVEHLHLELRLAGVPHEIVVVDDGSSDGTWQILLDLTARIP